MRPITRPGILEKQCQYALCGKWFTGTLDHGKDTWRKRRYCSTDCKQKAQVGATRAEVLTKVCEQCGRPFHNRRASGRAIEPYKWATTRFCSSGCKQKFQVGKFPPWLEIAKQDTAERFWALVDKSGGEDACWPFIGRRNKGGYGEFQIDGRKHLAHRVAWAIVNGPIPEGPGFHGTVIRHYECDNPACCNTRHHLPGTQRINMQDRDAKGRRFALLGIEHGMAKLQDEDVLAIRAMHATGRYSGQEIGEMFRVSLSTVSNIVNKKNWTHI